MSNYPEGANEDKRAPWHEKEPQTESCTSCNGTGSCSDLSDCCSAPIRFHDICLECGEHCDQAVCIECGGTGRVDLPEEEPDPDMYRDER